MKIKEMSKNRKHIRSMKRQGLSFSRYLGWHDKEKHTECLNSGLIGKGWMTVDFTWMNKDEC